MNKNNYLILISGKLGSGKDEVGRIFKEECPNLDLQIKKWAGKIKETVALWLGVTVEKLEDRDFKEAPLGPEWTVYYRANTIMLSTSSHKEIIKGPLFNTKVEAQEESPNIPPKHDLVETKIIEERLTPRRLLQLLGTDCGRNLIHPNIWVLTTLSEYKEGTNWAIPDTRFPNEIEGAQRKAHKIGSKVIIIRIERSLFNRTEGKYQTLNQVSEKDLKFYSKLTHPSEISLDEKNYKKEFDYYIDNNGSLKDLRNQVKNIIKWEDLNG